MNLHKITLSLSILMLITGAQAENATKSIWSIIFGEEDAALTDNTEATQRYWDDCFDCHSQRLKVKKLCAKFAKICKADIEKLRVKKACAQWLDAKHVDAEEMRTNKLCAKSAEIEDLKANHVAAREVDACNICTDQVSANYVCVNGNVEHCTKYKAHIALSTQTTYTFGDAIPFDIIVDDPNGNVSLAPFPRYIAPVSGYYEVTLGVGLSRINPGNGPISGIPTLRPEVLVNGLHYLKNVSAFLSFGGPFQNTVLSGIIRLNAGDEVYAHMDLFVQDPFTGVVRYTGTAELEAIDPMAPPFTETFMTIHYKSSYCPVTCPCPLPSLCEIPEVNCPTVDVDCHAHDCCNHHNHEDHHDHHDKDSDWF